MAAGPLGGDMCGLRSGDSERSRSVLGAFLAAASRPSWRSSARAASSRAFSSTGGAGVMGDAVLVVGSCNFSFSLAFSFSHSSSSLVISRGLFLAASLEARSASRSFRFSSLCRSSSSSFIFFASSCLKASFSSSRRLRASSCFRTRILSCLFTAPSEAYCSSVLPPRFSSSAATSSPTSAFLISLPAFMMWSMFLASNSSNVFSTVL